MQTAFMRRFAGAAVAAAALLLAGCGSAALGVKGDSLAPCPIWPHCVSSASDPGSRLHYIAPIRYRGDERSEMTRLKQVVGAHANASIVESSPRYLHAEFKTPTLGFVDDVEFYLQPQRIQIRSSSRVGLYDFQTNRKRLQGLRAALQPER